LIIGWLRIVDSQLASFDSDLPIVDSDFAYVDSDVGSRVTTEALDEEKVPPWFVR
jgi:hypothetical protein